MLKGMLWWLFRLLFLARAFRMGCGPRAVARREARRAVRRAMWRHRLQDHY